MRLTFFKTCALCALPGLAALSISGAALANGDHAGGHSHDAAHDDHNIGEPGLAANIQRTIVVEMRDNMRFSPDHLTVQKGQTVRFIVKNVGMVKHEFNLGTAQQLAEHAELMKKFPDMVHDDPNLVSVEPGQQGEVVWQFTHPGHVDFACLHPGHYAAGMKGHVKVSQK